MRKIGVINGLRGLAIIGVVWHHLGGWYTHAGWFRADIAGVQLNPFTLLSNGWVGVNLFFILSGFVLYLPYASGDRKMTSWADAAAFYKRRAGRLMPLYFVFVLVMLGVISGLVLLRGGEPPTWLLKDAVLDLTTAFALTEKGFMPVINPDLWSIAVEIWFSALFPAMLLLARRLGAGPVFICAALVSLAARYLSLYAGVMSLDQPPALNYLKDGLAGRLDDFALGMFICRLYVDGWRTGGRKASYAAVIGGAVVIVAGGNMWDALVDGTFPHPLVPIVSNVLQAGFFLIVAGFLSMDGGARAVVESRGLQLLGMMSYSIYIWHHVMMIFVVGKAPSPLNVGAWLVLTAAVCAASYRYVEFRGKKTGELFLLKAARPG